MRRKLLEKNPAVKNLLTALAVVTALATAIGGVLKLRQGSPPEPPSHALEITEIVVDRSEAMQLQIEGVSRLEVAKQSVRDVVAQIGTKDIFMLRDFGGSCDADVTRLLIKPGQQKESAIEGALNGLKANGSSGLARAVIEAAGDFVEGDRFKNLKKRIVVVTGSRDTCSRGDPIAEIRDRMDRIKDSDIKLDFHFIGIGLSASERDQVTAIAKATRAAPPAFVDRRADLPAAIHQVLVVQPVVQGAVQVETVLNAGLTQLNAVLKAIRERKYGEAESGIAQARAESDRSDKVVNEWNEGRGEEFQALYRQAEETRRIRNELVDIAEKMLKQAKANDIEAFNASVGAFNREAGAFNEHSKTINGLIRAMQSAAPGASPPASKQP
jgi:hypothetical protein